MKQKETAAVLMVLLAAACWGANGIFINILTAYGVNGTQMTLVRMTSMAILTGIWLAAKNPAALKIDLRDPVWFVPAGALGLFMFGLFYTYSIQLVGMGTAAVLIYLMPSLVMLFSVVFLHKKVAPSLWVSVVLGLTGLYFISVKEGFTISPSDALVLLSAVIYAVYILAADYYVRFCSPTELNCAQFIVASVVCLIGMFAVEEPTLAELRENIVPILYLGIFSSALAYTLQFAAQRNGNPVAVTLLLSMESVFSVLGAAVLLHEFLSGRELFGCGIMLCAVILVQLPEGFWKRKKKTNNE